jgi:hypothetical protein
MVSRWLRVIVSIFVVVWLAACSPNSDLPSRQIVSKAIAIQVALTQQQISQQLKLDFPTITVDHVRIQDQEPMTIQGLQSYLVKGNYDYSLKLKQRTVNQQDSAFEVYLQRQAEGKTWRLVQKQQDTDSNAWLTWLVE